MQYSYSTWYQPMSTSLKGKEDTTSDFASFDSGALAAGISSAPAISTSSMISLSAATVPTTKSTGGYSGSSCYTTGTCSLKIAALHAFTFIEY
jgi:hypothetical protein